MPPDAAAAARLLAADGVLLLPTDTLPGLHARADRPAAVRRVAALKGRPGDKPLVVIAGSIEAALAVAAPLDAQRLDFARRCWPGPFSLVLPAASDLDPVVTGGGATVAVRVPDRPRLAALLALVGGPLVSTSANRSGEPPAVTLDEAAARFGDLVDGIFDPGDPAQAAGAASAVVDLTAWPPQVLRPGPRPLPSWDGAPLDRPDGGL
ncbi:MAG TPA: L-threonylcarbamoyladenylate synthase [Candidatus Krumholzibacteria bacterium]|nr:L-threonylcarbamoyladenylate synthase [Candidatus Krumholzibacteria bacterium]